MMKPIGNLQSPQHIRKSTHIRAQYQNLKICFYYSTSLLCMCNCMKVLYECNKNYFYFLSNVTYKQILYLLNQRRRFYTSPLNVTYKQFLYIPFP